MKEEKEKKDKLNPLTGGDPYVIVVSSGGPPSQDDDTVDDEEGASTVKVKFPFEIQYSSNGGTVTKDVTIYVDIIDSQGNSIDSYSYAVQLSSNSPSTIDVKVDYSTIPTYKVSFIQLKWGEQNSSPKHLMLTVPFSFPENKKKYLKKVNLSYQNSKV